MLNLKTGTRPAATMAGRPYHLQLVRPGIALFGGRAILARNNPMVPVVALEVPIVQVRTVKGGETVGYGAGHSFERDGKIAILPIGYGDGLLRAMGSATTYTGARFALGGTRVPGGGRISMDLVAIDVTEVPEGLAVPGREVEVLGPNVGIDDLADDDLPGKPGDPEHSYLGLMRQNLLAMIPALGGDAAAMAGLDVGNVFDGASGAVYPQ